MASANSTAPAAHSERARNRKRSGCAQTIRTPLVTAPTARARPVVAAVIESWRSNSKGMRKMLAYRPMPYSGAAARVPAKGRYRSTDRSTAGERAVRSRLTKSQPKSSAGASSHARCAQPSCSEMSAAARSVAPRRSKPSGRGAGCTWRLRSKSRLKRPSGTLTQKIVGHPKWSVSTPPRGGPKSGPSTAATPTSATAVPRRSPG